MDHAPRILGGDARGRKLDVPPGRETRPILALLKSRLFDILGQRMDDLVTWDLFAGSGALGLEALSRGGSHCLFVERGNKAFKCLDQNVTALGFSPVTTLLKADVLEVDYSLQDSPSPDLVFLDPPFPLVEQDAGSLVEFIESRLVKVVNPGCRFVFRTPIRVELPRLPEGLSALDRRDHGENVLNIWKLKDA